MRQYISKCKQCNATFQNNQKNNKIYCTICIRKRRSLQVMQARQRKNPNIIIGCGSGNHPVNMQGPTNKAWKTGIIGYHKLFDLTKEKCAKCGAQSNNPYKMCVHHLDENRHNNNLNNLEILCKRCHQELHAVRDPITGRYMAK